MTGKLVSAVIPTYNYGRFVAEAVDSVLAQGYRDREVIVVDDGSTDDTRQRLAPYLDRIRYIYQDNRGLSAARNAGIGAARGEYVALLDSDDVWHPRKLELQMRYLAEHPDVGLLAAAHVMDRSAGWAAVDGPPADAAVPATLDELVMFARFAPSSVVIRKDCFDAVGLFDTALRSAEDRDMWIRIADRFPVVKLDLPLIFYRVHGASMSNAAARMEENELKVLRKAFTGIRSLRWRLGFRLKTFSYAAYNAAYMYGAARRWLPALGRVLRSFLLWPLPYRRREVDRPLARPKMLAVNLLRLLHLRPPEPPGAAAFAGTPGQGMRPGR
jgi:glycosyltransferase involved in cell wall biosynthesis